MLITHGIIYACEKCGQKYVSWEEAHRCEHMRDAEVSGIVAGDVVTWKHHSGYGTDVDNIPYTVRRVFISPVRLTVGRKTKRHLEYATMCITGACALCSNGEDNTDGMKCSDGYYTTETTNLTKRDIG